MSSNLSIFKFYNIMKYSIYIYKLNDLDQICCTFPKHLLSEEMNLFDHFVHNLKIQYNIVNDINKADIAFIPIDFTKLIYIGAHHSYSIVPVDCPPTPPTEGVEHKNVIIEYYWNRFVSPYLLNIDKIKHFMIYSYVLYDISFEYIPNKIHIFSYEDRTTFSDNNINEKEYPVIIPYPLNGNKIYKQSIIKNYMKYEKKYNLAFFGSLDRNDILLYYRSFIRYLSFPLINYSGKEAYKYLPNVKYLFVLRGDTPTRLNFYQCFAYDIVPIIFKKEINLYKKLLCPEINIEESCLILPDIENNKDIEYAVIVDDLLKRELSDENNYINKIKNHEIIFNNFNWYEENSSIKPLENIVNYLVNI